MFAWHSLPEWLPESLQEGLLHGTVGKTHLTVLAGRALEASAAAGTADAAKLRDLGVELARLAWENDLFDAGMAANHARVAPSSPGAQLAAAVAGGHKRPDDLSYLMRLISKGDAALIRNYLEQQCRKEPGNLFWLQQGMVRAVYEGEWEWGQKLLETAHDSPFAILVAKAAADLLLYAGQNAQAAEAYARVAQHDIVDVSFPLGEALFRAGEREEAVAIWRKALEQMPWHVNLLLRLHDVALGLDKKVEQPAGGVAVLLYTWNKAADLEQTLVALAPSLGEGVKLLVLDNGSTDETPFVLERWQELLGAARMRSLRLPVNIGAPAARNWLLHEPETLRSRWVAYIDDDAPLPENWLGRLGAAATAYPEAGVWGCKVVYASNPVMLQHVDLHLTDPREVVQEPYAPNYARKFSLSNLQIQVANQGQFSYLRPCTSVTGCVHLFLRERLEESGEFDLRFTPSQYDDVEHDLRLALQGRIAVYQGHLEAPHLKRSGRAAMKDPKEQARALGNLYKLQMLYNPEQIDGLRSWHRRALLADIEAKSLRL